MSDEILSPVASRNADEAQKKHSQTVPNYTTSDEGHEPKCPGWQPSAIDDNLSLTITNAVFYDAVFHTLDEGATAWSTAFRQPPDQAENRQWSGSPVQREQLEQEIQYTDGGHNTFYCVSSFKVGQDGQVHRRVGNYVATHATVMDDIGSGPSAKISWDRVALAPSFVIETSPGNCQVGYILDRPEHDADKVDRVVDALVEQGLASPVDPGMKGRTRYVRMPVGVNNKTKYQTPHRHVVRLWEPERRYSLEEIIKGYGLKLLRRRSTSYRDRIPVEASSDPFLKVFEDLGWVLTGELRGSDLNMIDVLCPWHEEHTDRVDQGAAYFIGGGFKCFHGHCIERTFKNVKEKLAKDYDVDVIALTNQLKAIEHRARREDAQVIYNALFGKEGVK